MIYLLSISLLIIQIIASLIKFRYGIFIYVINLIIFPQAIYYYEVPSFSFNTLTSLIFLVSCIKANRINYKIFINQFPLRKEVVVLLLFLSPSYLFSTENLSPLESTLSLLNYFIKTLLPGILIYFSIKNPDDLKFVTKSIFSVIIIMTFYGLTEIIFKKNFFWLSLELDNIKNFSYSEEDRLGIDFKDRVKSTCWHAITYSMWLAIFYSLILFFKINSKKITNKKRFSNFQFLLISGIIFINSFFTISRSGWLCLIIVITLLIYKNWKEIFPSKIKKFETIILFSPIVYIAASIFWNLFSKIKEGSSYDMRIEQFNYIYKTFIEKSLYVGYGPHSVSEFINSANHYDALGFESFLFQVFVNNGLLGLIGYTYFYYGIIKCASNSNGLLKIKNFVIPITVTHLIFIILTGEMQTIFLFFVAITFLLKFNIIYSKKIDLLRNNFL